MTSIAHQYRIITSRAGWIDRSGRGRVRFSGADARSFLQALLTNDLSALERHHGLYAAYLTPQGRMIADMTVVDRGDALIALVAEGRGEALATRFDQLVFAEDVTVTDVTGAFVEIEVTGGAAAEVVSAATGVGADALAERPDLAQVDFADGFVLRDGVRPFPTFRILAAAASPAIRDRIVQAIEEAGAVAMSDEMSTALRIEAGRAAWGYDLDEDVIPLEAGLLDRAISTSKGCYVGQEIVIRILHRGGGRVAKRLVTLEFDESEQQAPDPGAVQAPDGAPVGKLTSVAWSPARGRFIALGYVRREAAEAGTRVVVATSGAPAVVTGLAQ